MVIDIDNSGTIFSLLGSNESYSSFINNTYMYQIFQQRKQYSVLFNRNQYKFVWVSTTGGVTTQVILFYSTLYLCPGLGIISPYSMNPGSHMYTACMYRRRKTISLPTQGRATSASWSRQCGKGSLASGGIYHTNNYLFLFSFIIINEMQL